MTYKSYFPLFWIWKSWRKCSNGKTHKVMIFNNGVNNNGRQWAWRTRYHVFNCWEMVINSQQLFCAQSVLSLSSSSPNFNIFYDIMLFSLFCVMVTPLRWKENNQYCIAFNVKIVFLFVLYSECRNVWTLKAFYKMIHSPFRNVTLGTEVDWIKSENL